MLDCAIHLQGTNCPVRPSNNLMEKAETAAPPAPEAAGPAPVAPQPVSAWLERWLEPRKGMVRSLRHRNYRLFWTGNFLSNTGTWMHNVALGWLVLELTGSPALLGLLGFAQFGPSLLLSLPGGVIADRVNRRRWLLITHTAMLTFALALAVLSALHLLTYAQILLLAFLLGVTSALNAPSFQAMVRDLSSRDDVLNAIALNSIQFNLSRFIGPAIAGQLIATVGVTVCFFVNAASFMFPLIALTQVRYKYERQTHSTSGAEDLREGFAYLRQHKRILLLISVVAMVSFFGMPYLIFLPVFARDVLNAGAGGLGVMVAASGVGALLGGLVLATWPDGRRRGPLVFGGAFLFFLGVLGLALSRNFYLSLAALMLVGGSMICASATINSLIQTLVADNVRGRVLSWHTMAYLGLHPLGALLIGQLAERWSTPNAIAGSVSVALIILTGIFFAAPELRHLD